MPNACRNQYIVKRQDVVDGKLRDVVLGAINTGTEQLSLAVGDRWTPYFINQGNPHSGVEVVVDKIEGNVIYVVVDD